MKKVCIITARGGSKRIPHKNIKEFCGRPIIEYSIEAALQSELFDEVMVSTDSKQIADISMKAGASVPFYRSAEMSDDNATTDDVLSEVLKRYADRGIRYEIMCNVYPTAPFVTNEKLKTAYNMMMESGADSIMPVVKYSFPPQRGVVIQNNIVSYIHPEDYSKRSQDLEPIYHDAGQFYFYRVHEDLSFDSMHPTALVVNEMEVQDIDNISDWKIAELKYKLMKY